MISPFVGLIESGDTVLARSDTGIPRGRRWVSLERMRADQPDIHVLGCQKGAVILQLEEMRRFLAHVRRMQEAGGDDSQAQSAEAEVSLQQVLERGGRVAASHIRAHPEDFLRVEEGCR